MKLSIIIEKFFDQDIDVPESFYVNDGYIVYMINSDGNMDIVHSATVYEPGDAYVSFDNDNAQYYIDDNVKVVVYERLILDI